MDTVIESLAGYSLTKGWKYDQKTSNDGSAHFVDVIARSNAPLMFMCADPANMILRHNRYGNPREILAYDRVTLWTITSNQAIFTVCSEDVFDT